MLYRREFIPFVTSSGCLALTGCVGLTSSSSKGCDEAEGGFGPRTYGGSGVGGGLPCVTAWISMHAINNEEIVERAYHRVADFGSESHEVFVRAAGKESITITSRSNPFPQPAVGFHNDSLYRISSKVIGSESVTEYTVNIDPVSGPISKDELVQFQELPEVDREKLTTMGFGEEHNTAKFATLELLYRQYERNASVIVPTPNRSVVAWESGVKSRISVEGSRPETVYSYRVSAKKVAPNLESYGRKIRGEFEFPLTDLSSDEREIVDQAIAGGYRVDAKEDPPDELISLVNRFRSHREAPFMTRAHVAEGNVAREYLVRYGDETYYVELIIDETEYPTGQKQSSSI